MARISSIFSRRFLAVLALPFLVIACGGDDIDDDDDVDTGSDGPNSAVEPVIHQTGDVTRGRDVFRNELFGTERFWTDAMRLQQGFVNNNVTPLQALAIGLSVDIDALDAPTRAVIAAELATDRSPANAPTLNNPATTVALINANAVIGIVPKDSNGDGVINIAAGDKTGASCALCHTRTDQSVLSNAGGGGSIGKRLDGRASHNLDFGGLIALADNSRAYYPVLQLALTANGGASIGRNPARPGLTETSSEATVDAYLRDKVAYPIGMFDDTVDGNGDPMHNSALFRTDLAAPWGTEGGIARLDNFGNLVYTALLDPTNLTTPGGRAFLIAFGGTAAGTEIADDYEAVLAATGVVKAAPGVPGYPYVVATAHPMPGSEDAPTGVRVDNQKLLDMNAYLNSLQAPAGVVTSQEAVSRGRSLFRNGACVMCHNVDQSRAVPAFIAPMIQVFPGDMPMTIPAPGRNPQFNPILNTVASIFDDKMAVVNASQRLINGVPGERGLAMPLLLDLAAKPNFLHDNSVPNMDTLLNPSRGATAPHPFYFADAAQRADMVEFLRGLSTD